jgi:hypothetical protein
MSVTASSVTGSPTIQSIFDFTSASGNTYFKNGAAATAGTTVASGDRISVSAIASATSMNVRIGCGAWFANRTNESVTLTQFHWHPGSAPVAYYENTGTSPRYDSARFDHDPTTLAPKGLLIEATATNFASNSETFPTSGTGLWAYEDVTANATKITAPDGTANAIQFNETTANNVHRIGQSVSGSAGAVSVSVWVKVLQPGTPRRLFINANTFMNARGLFDIDPAVQTGASGTAVSVTGTAANRAGTWIKYPNDWYRCTLIGTYSTASTVYFQINRASSSTATDDIFAGSTTNGLAIWGAQVEAGSGASSYIPTGASQGTRNQDQVQMTNLASLGFNTNAGTMTINGTYNKDANAFPRSIRFMGSSVQSMAMITSGKMLYGNAPNTSGGTYFDVFRTLSSFGAFKYGFSLTTATSPATGLGVISLNGSSTSITPLGQGAIVNPVTLDFLYGAGAPTDYPSMNVASMKYWPYAMTGTQLNAMTA